MRLIVVKNLLLENHKFLDFEKGFDIRYCGYGTVYQLALFLSCLGTEW